MNTHLGRKNEDHVYGPRMSNTMYAKISRTVVFASKGKSFKNRWIPCQHLIFLPECFFFFTHHLFRRFVKKEEQDSIVESMTMGQLGINNSGSEMNSIGRGDDSNVDRSNMVKEGDM